MNFSNTGIKCPYCRQNYVNSCDNVAESLIYMDNIYGPYVHIFTKDCKYVYNYDSVNKEKVNGVHKLEAANKFQLNGIIREQPESFILFMCKCPKCNKVFSFIVKCGKQYSHGTHKIKYISPSVILPKHYNNYVPKSIREDYKEACSILYLSPQSSATLSRRILEEILDNYFKVPKTYTTKYGKTRYFNLKNKIEQLRQIKDPNLKLSSQTIKDLDALREIGNAGAHMDVKKNEIVKVTKDEAKNLLKMVEILIDKTYVEKYNHKKLSESLKKSAEKHK